MINLEGRRIFIAVGTTDMRRAIDSLSVMVENGLGGQLFSGDLFAFCNRGRNNLKILWWDRNGFCLWQKRLEKDRFHWPESEEEAVEITPRQLAWLLDGFDIQQAHQRLEYRMTV